MRYTHNYARPRFKKKLTIAISILAILVIFIIGYLQFMYNQDLKPVSSSQNTQLVTIAQGSSVKQIADLLSQDKLIRSSWAFQIYTRTHNLANNLQAGTYSLSPSESTEDIVVILTKGKVKTNLVTILPGKRIDQIKTDLINDGFSPASVDNALNPSQYSGLPVMALKPASVNTLEGLLWPDSFQKAINDTDPTPIIRESLMEMSQHLTPAVQQAFAAEGLSPYQGLTLASIIQQEVSRPSDQTQVAQVFLTRLKSNMPLGSDVTAYYASIEAGQAPNLSYNSPYNTLLNTGLPPTPIATVDTNSLSAAEHPASTNWLYFVTGDNGVTYFSTTLAQHQQQTSQYCHKLCGQ
ncbi:MAG TPA: endolytic transglycosylase MltG [Candidatus Saccharimonadales bacterium]|nr:endolytic transglycosylase MltG [Candidatus Saccharimonadales bacterium]